MKIRTVAICILMLTVLMAGCGKDKETESNNENATATETAADNSNTAKEPEVQEPVQDIVGVSYSNEGTFSVPFEEDVSMDYEYSINVPMIMDDSDDAREINEEIDEFTKDSISVLEDILNDRQDVFTEPNFIGISYESFENGNIVSVIVEGDAIYSDWREYRVFNYDRAGHKRVSNDELIASTGLSEEEFLSRVRGTLGNCVKSELISFMNPEEIELADEARDEDSVNWYYRMVADFMGDLAQTIGNQNVNSDMMMYLDENGDPNVIAFVYAPAGAGQYYFKAKVEDISIEDVTPEFMEYAQNYYYDGFEKDCLNLYDIEGFSGTVSAENETGDLYEQNVYIGFMDTDPAIFITQYVGDDEAICYEGSINLVDIDENGMKFSYEFTKRDSSPIDSKIPSGTFYLSPFSYYDETIESMMSGAVYRYNDGDNLIPSEADEVELEKTFG